MWSLQASRPEHTGTAGFRCFCCCECYRHNTMTTICSAAVWWWSIFYRVRENARLKWTSGETVRGVKTRRVTSQTLPPAWAIAVSFIAESPPYRKRFAVMCRILARPSWPIHYQGKWCQVRWLKKGLLLEGNKAWGPTSESFEKNGVGVKAPLTPVGTATTEVVLALVG